MTYVLSEGGMVRLVRAVGTPVAAVLKDSRAEQFESFPRITAIIYIYIYTHICMIIMIMILNSNIIIISIICFSLIIMLIITITITILTRGLALARGNVARQCWLFSHQRVVVADLCMYLYYICIYRYTNLSIYLSIDIYI